MRTQKVTGDFNASGFEVTPKKNWRGKHLYKNVQGFESKKYSVCFEFVVNLQKRAVYDESLIKSFKTFKDYYKCPTKGSTLASRSKKSSSKRIKASVWCTQNFPFKFKDFYPVLETLSNFSKKASRLNNILKSCQLEEVGFPVKIKAPIMWTVKAVAKFKNVHIGQVDSSLFEVDTKRYLKNSFTSSQFSTISAQVSHGSEEEEDIDSAQFRFQTLPDSEDEDKFVGPKVTLETSVQPKVDTSLESLE